EAHDPGLEALNLGRLEAARGHLRPTILNPLDALEKDALGRVRRVDQERSRHATLLVQHAVVRRRNVQEALYDLILASREIEAPENGSRNRMTGVGALSRQDRLGAVRHHDVLLGGAARAGRRHAARTHARGATNARRSTLARRAARACPAAVARADQPAGATIASRRNEPLRIVELGGTTDDRGATEQRNPEKERARTKEPTRTRVRGVHVGR